MPKIRGIHPGYWTDEDIVELSIPARLLFIGLWTYACDNGHLDDKPKQIRMRLFPADDVDIDSLLDELVAQKRITREAGTITIHKFAHHQKPHTRWWTTCDLPLCVPPEGAGQRGKKPSQTPSQPLPHGGTTVVHGGSPDDVDCDVDVEGDGDTSSAPASAGDATELTRFDEFWETYAKKVGRKKAEQKWRLAIRKPGVDADLLITSAAAYVARQRRNGKHPEFTKDPATWLNGEHWNDEELASEAEQPSQPESVWERFGFEVVR